MKLENDLPRIQSIRASSIRTDILFTAALGIIFSSLPMRAEAQPHSEAAAFPNKPIRMVVPASPGGGLDTLARISSKKMTEGIGHAIVVENKAGAGGNIAMEYVARASADGYTMLVGNLELATSPSLYKSLPFNPLRDFAPVSLGVLVSNVLVLNPAVPANSVQELLALARAKPGTLNYSSGSTGSLGHLAGELFANLATVKLVHIPYKGGGPAMTDLLGGQIQMSFSSPATAIQHVKAGRLKALGVTTTYRLTALPDLPTIAEAGLPGYDAKNWYVFVAPAQTPAARIAKLNQEISRALTSPDVKATLVAQGMDPSPGTPGELGSFLRAETVKWQTVIKAAGFALN